MGNADEILREAEAAAVLPVGTIVRFCSKLGVRVGEVVGHAEEGYLVATDDAELVVDQGHIVECL